jgi:hypothetical protein
MNNRYHVLYILSKNGVPFFVEILNTKRLAGGSFFAAAGIAFGATVARNMSLQGDIGGKKNYNAQKL